MLSVLPRKKTTLRRVVVPWRGDVVRRCATGLFEQVVSRPTRLRPCTGALIDIDMCFGDQGAYGTNCAVANGAGPRRIQARSPGVPCIADE